MTGDYWAIHGGGGAFLGVYQGADVREALEALARDAGYPSQADAPAPFTGTVTLVTCDSCHGTGDKVYCGPVAWEDCPVCDGKGYTDRPVHS